MGTERDFVVKKGLKVAEDIELGHATDTTIARASAGDVNIEGNIVYRAGGTDVPVTDGGTGVSTLTDGGILLGNGAGAIQAMAVLSDGQMIVGDGTTDPSVESGATLRTSIGVGTGDTVQFTGINLGHASDTTIARASAGVISVEGVVVPTISSASTLTNKTIAVSQVTELSNLTADEGAQLENIGSVTISNAQWGYLGAATGAITNTDTNTQNEYATSFVDSSNDVLLRLTESGAGSGTQDIKFVAGSNITLTPSGTNMTIAASGGSSGIASLAADSTPQLGGDLDVNGNKITSASNAAITIEPNGTGDINLYADTVVAGDASTDFALQHRTKTNSAMKLLNNGNNQFIADANIYLNADEAGNGGSLIRLNAITSQLGKANNNAVLTTQGTGDLTLSTNGGTNSGTIVIADGANNDITLTPNGTGQVTISAQMTSRANVVAVSSNTTLTLAQSGSYVYWTSNTLTLPASGTVGTQYTVINNTGGSATVAVNASNCSLVAGFSGATNATTAIADHELASFVCVTANTWIQVG